MHSGVNKELPSTAGVKKTGDIPSIPERGQHAFLVIAGPCSLESQEQLKPIIELLKSSQLFLMRGGVWKLRTDPRSFQGLGEEALPLLQNLRDRGLGLVTEVTDPRQIEFLLPWVHSFQVGARNMYNYSLLKELSLYDKPVVFKRAFSATVDEWLKASEYLQRGRSPVVLCERGIRTFETSSRFTFDLNGALIAKQRSGLPVLVDPSHAVGLREYVPALALATVAAGLDGLLIEVHPQPDAALSDGRQSMSLESFKELMRQIDKMLPIVQRRWALSFEDWYARRGQEIPLSSADGSLETSSVKSAVVCTSEP
jgi:3-deoxy-7-phosphoheptulonate synthase